MKKVNSLIFLFCLIGFFTMLQYSCLKDMGTLPKTPTVPSQSFCDSADVKWSTDIQPIINTNCAISGCHNISAAGGVNFTPGYSAVDTARIRARVLDGNPSYMPQAGQLPLLERKKIECWLKEGAPNN